MRLEANEVFVFGSNARGFHGAGAAGLACRGTSKNNWRIDPWFLRAMKAPEGHPDRVGVWAIYGQSRGFQIGREGKSFAIQTIERPGLRRSTPLDVIGYQLTSLYIFAMMNQALRFIITRIGQGYAGYTADEMCETFNFAGDIPSNCIMYDHDMYISGT